MDLNGANKKISQLSEADIIPDYDVKGEALEVWQRLVIWFDYARNFETENEALKGLKPGDGLWEIHQSLLWAWRFFVPFFPADLRRGDWVSLGKLSFECFITGAFDYAGLSVEELGKEEYFSDCLEFTKYNLMEHLEK